MTTSTPLLMPYSPPILPTTGTENSGGLRSSTPTAKSQPCALTNGMSGRLLLKSGLRHRAPDFLINRNLAYCPLGTARSLGWSVRTVFKSGSSIPTSLPTLRVRSLLSRRRKPDELGENFDPYECSFLEHHPIKVPTLILKGDTGGETVCDRAHTRSSSRRRARLEIIVSTDNSHY